MSEASEGALARLRFHLEMQEGFWFALVVGPDDPARASLRDAAGDHGPVEDLEALKGRELDLAVSLTQPRKALAWVRVDDLRVASVLLAAMNERREAYRRATGAGVVLEGPSWLKAALRNAAPDLFSIRACILEPSPVDDAPLLRDITEEVSAPQSQRRVVQLPPPPEEARTNINRDLKRAASLADRGEGSAVRARIASLRRAAQALLDQGWVGEAAGIVDELVELVSEAPDELWVRPERATAWELAGRVARQVGDLDETREAFDTALAAVQTVRDGRPLDGSTASLQEDEARLWWELGEVAWSMGELGRAQACLGRALALREALLEFRLPMEDLSELREGIARTFSLLADVAEAAGRPEDAADAWVAALEIRSDLVKLHPADATYARSLAISLGRVAKVCWAEGDWRGALELRRQAWALIQELVDREPFNAVWLVEVSTARTRLAQLHMALGRTAAARVHLEAVFELRQGLTRLDPDNMDWTYRFAATLSSLAELTLAEGDARTSVVWSQRALHRLEGLREEDPDRIIWALTQQRALELRAEGYWKLGRYLPAAASLAEAASDLDELLARDPRPRWLRRRCRMRTREGDAWFAAGQSAPAADAWTRALAGAEEPLTRSHLGAMVGLAQVGELPGSSAEALITQLEQSEQISGGEAQAWRAALTLGEHS